MSACALPSKGFDCHQFKVLGLGPLTSSGLPSSGLPTSGLCLSALVGAVIVYLSCVRVSAGVHVCAVPVLSTSARVTSHPSSELYRRVGEGTRVPGCGFEAPRPKPPNPKWGHHKSTPRSLLTSRFQWSECGSMRVESCGPSSRLICSWVCVNRTGLRSVRPRRSPERFCVCCVPTSGLPSSGTLSYLSLGLCVALVGALWCW